MNGLDQCCLLYRRLRWEYDELLMIEKSCCAKFGIPNPNPGKSETGDPFCVGLIT